jgi:hypothetical protein
VIRSKSKGRTLPAVNLWAVPTKRVDWSPGLTCTTLAARGA